MRMDFFEEDVPKADVVLSRDCLVHFSNSEIRSGESLTVSLQLKNTGGCLGTEVFQVYIRDDESNLVRPDKELKAFKKVSLKPGEAAQISFDLDDSALAYFDDAQMKWIKETGKFTILIGSSSQDIRLSGKFLLSGD